MTTGLLLLFLVCASHSPIFTNAQEVPNGHAPGNPGRKGGHLCNLMDGTMLIGEIPVSRVATLFEGSDSSASSKNRFIAGKTPNGLRRALVSFDMSSVNWPSDVKVACAEVRLAVDQSASTPSPMSKGMTLHPITTPWTTNGFTTLAGTHGSPAQQGDATWKYASYPSESWQNQGGDFKEDSLSREFSIAGADGIQYSYFGSTKRMHAIVNEWIRDSQNNHGLMIKADEQESDPMAHNMYHGVESNPNEIPNLIVVYTAPSLGFQHQEPESTNSPISDGNFDQDGNWHQVGDSSNYDSSNGGNTGNGATGNPQPGEDSWHQVGDSSNYGSSSNNKIDSDASSNQVAPTTRRSNSGPGYIAVVGVCLGLAGIMVLASAFHMRKMKAGIDKDFDMNESGEEEVAEQTAEKEIV